LFPLDWLTGLTGRFLNAAFHDVPWQEPNLVEAGIRNRLHNGPWLTYENLERIMRCLRYCRNVKRISRE
jgi:hypothetical protein